MLMLEYMLRKKDKRNKSGLKVFLVAKNVQSCGLAAKPCRNKVHFMFDAFVKFWYEKITTAKDNFNLFSCEYFSMLTWWLYYGSILHIILSFYANYIWQNFAYSTEECFTSVLSIYQRYLYTPFILFWLPYDRHDSLNVCAHSKFWCLVIPAWLKLFQPKWLTLPSKQGCPCPRKCN